MPIAQSILRSAARQRTQTINKSYQFSAADQQNGAFLCHSHLDRELAEGLQATLSEYGWTVYVDWADEEMPPRPDVQTAARIKTKILGHKWFLFLATSTSMASRWCPWEIGFADHAKRSQNLLIVPTKDDLGKFIGNEYLQLYRHLDTTTDGKLAAFMPGQSRGGIVVGSLRLE